MSFEHLSPADIAGLLDNGVSLEARRRIEHHLDACEQCRHELNAAADLTDSWMTGSSSGTSIRNNPRPWRFLKFAIPSTIAAAAAIVILANDSAHSRFDNPEAVRETGSVEGRSAIPVVAPGPDEDVARRGAAFAWHRSGAGFFRFTLLSEDGAPVFAAETQDTAILLPDSIVLDPERNYFWRVDRVDNGVEATTGARLLKTRE